MVVAVLVTSCSSIAVAQGTDQERAQALYEEAATLFEAGQHGAALERLERSYRLFESLRTLYSIGMCLHALGRYPRALESLERYLARGGDQVPPALRRQARDAVTQMRRDMASLAVEVSEPGAAISVDGAHVGTSPLAGPVPVGPGAHVVEATLAGFARGRVDASVVARERAAVRVELVAEVVVDGSEIEASLVRVVGLRGVRAESSVSDRTGYRRSFFDTSASHGVGVVVTGSGLVVVSREVVAGVDVVALMFSGERDPRFGRVVTVEEAPGLAFVVASGEQFPRPCVVAEGEGEGVRVGDDVTAWARTYERLYDPPRSVRGRVVRLTPNGQAELSLPLGFSNTGGPVFDAAGRLVGMVSEARVGNLMEPLAAFAAASRTWSRPAETVGPGRDAEREAARAVMTLAVGAPRIEVAELLGRLSTLGDVAGLPPSIAAALALYAYAAWLDEIERHDVADTSSLPEDIRRPALRLLELASSLARRARAANPILIVRYPALTTIADLGGQQACGTEGAACCAGACEEGLRCLSSRCERHLRAIEPRRHAERPYWRSAWFRLGAAGVLVFDDHPRAQAVGGGAATVLGHAQFLPIGALRPVQLSFLAGAELTVGSFRDVAAVSFLADVGLRLALGSPRVAGALTLLYDLGVIYAEKRTSFVYASYRVMLGLQLRRLAFGASYQETGRGADSTLRGLSLYVDWAF